MGELMGEAAVGELLWGRCCMGAAVGNYCGGVAGVLWGSCCGFAADFLQHFFETFSVTFLAGRTRAKRKRKYQQVARMPGLTHTNKTV